MIILISFGLILVLVFGLVLFFTRSTSAEKALEQRLTAVAPISIGTTIEPDNILRTETYSTLPWLNVALERLRPASGLRKLLQDANVTWSVGRFVLISCLAAPSVFAFSSYWLDNLYVRFFLGFVSFLAPTLYLVWLKQKRRKKFSTQLPSAMDLLSRALRAGNSITAAISMVGQEIPDPVGPEFKRVFEEQNLGLPLRDALLELARRVDTADIRFLVSAILIQRETGGNLVEVLDKTTAVLRDRIRIHGEVRTHTAQGRMTGFILSGLPILTFIGLSIINPAYINTLTGDSFGRMLLVAGVSLMIVGFLVIRKIVTIEV
jgi:tight adherence protein B